MFPIGEQEDMLFFPYNSEIAVNVLGEEEQDRLYDSQDFADYFRQFVGNGVFPNPAHNLRVDSVNNSLVLTVLRGSAFINGRFYLQRRDFEFAVQPAHLTMGRRDIVVARHDIIARTTQLFYVPGVAAATPQVPQIQRTDDVFDLQLCTITVNPNAQAVTQANILDTRPNNAVCGFVTGLIQQVDTSILFQQYERFFNEQVAFWNSRINDVTNQQNHWVSAQENFMNEWREGRLRWTREQEEIFETLGAEIRELILSIETQSFMLINHNFDDISVRRGCDRITSFPGGNVLESIIIAATGFVLATRETAFLGSQINESITFFPFEIGGGAGSAGLSMTRRTIFEANGSIREEIR